MYFQETNDNLNIIFWCVIFGDEAQNGNTPGLSVQVEDDGSSTVQDLIHILGKYISYLQNSAYIV